MKKFTALVLFSALWGANVQAQDLEIEVPNGWTANESGISKGNDKLLIGPVLDLEGLTPTEYLGKLAEVESIEGYEITSIAEIKDTEYLVSIQRELIQGENKARSIFMICKDGRNKHRLLELFTENVVNVIAGARAAVNFCVQP